MFIYLPEMSNTIDKNRHIGLVIKTKESFILFVDRQLEEEGQDCHRRDRRCDTIPLVHRYAGHFWTGGSFE